MLTRRLTGLNLLIALFLFGTSVDATENQTRPEKELFEPEAKSLKCEDGQTYMVFDEKGSKRLSKLIVDYHTIWGYLLSLEAEIASLKRELVFQQTRVEWWKNAADEQKDRGNLYMGMWRKDHTLYLQAETRYSLLQERQRKYSWIPWGMVALEAIAFTVVSVAK